MSIQVAARQVIAIGLLSRNTPSGGETSYLAGHRSLAKLCLGPDRYVTRKSGFRRAFRGSGIYLAVFRSCPAPRKEHQKLVKQQTEGTSGGFYE